jgi:hypothetical protein
MTLVRKEPVSDSVRDIKGDYIRAYLAEYHSYKAAGLEKRAEDVARALRDLGHEVQPARERAVSPPPVERAVEADVAPPKPPRAPVKRTRTKPAAK